MSRMSLVFLLSALTVSAHAAEYTLSPSDNLESALELARADYVDSGAVSVITLAAGDYPVTHEIYLDWPVTVKGATGNPEDVAINGNDTFRIFTINHAEAEVKDLTIAHGRYVNEGQTYGWGNAGVRICSPYSLDRTDLKNWHSCKKGAGGKLTHCVVRDCGTPYFHSWGIVYLNGPKDQTVVDRCDIRNNIHTGQENGQKGKGDFVTVESGIFRNSLVRDNTTTLTHVASPATSYQGVVTVCGADAEVVGCTIVNNYQKGHNEHQVAGVLALSGKVVNTLIAGNRIDQPTEPRDRVWSGAENCFVNCVADWPEPINSSCRAVADAGFVDPSVPDYRLCLESEAVGAGDATFPSVGGLDLAGRPRLSGATVDVGAYAYTAEAVPFVRFFSSLEGEGHEGDEVSLSAFSCGLGTDLVYVWSLGEGSEPYMSDSPTYTVAPPYGTYSVTLTVSNTTTQASMTVTRENLFQIRFGSHVFRIDPATEGADAFQKTYDWVCEQDGSRTIAQTFVLLPGVHQITNEVMLTCPWTVCGSTGKADDVTVDVQDMNKAFCLNDPHAVLHSLTVTRGKCSGVHSYGIVRINEPNGRGNQTNSDKGSSRGGLVSNVVVTASRATDKLSASHLYARGGLITHSIVRDSTAWHQGDSANNNGLFLWVRGGTARNCLVADNEATVSDLKLVPADDYGFFASAAIESGLMIGCTIANNTIADDNGNVSCAGVRALGGKVVNTLIFGNRVSNSTLRPHMDQWCAPSADVFVSCLTDGDEPINETCRVATDARFLSPTLGFYSPVKGSPCIAAGTLDEAYDYGETDLMGLPRVNGSEAEGRTIDIGAYQFNPSHVLLDVRQTLPECLYDSVRATFDIAAAGFGDDPVYYIDFDSDGTTDLVTRESHLVRDFPLGVYRVTVVASNLVDEVGHSFAIDSGFSVTPHPVHYVDVNGTNPVSPYSTPATAATSIPAALDVARKYEEVVILPGTYEISRCIYVTNEWVRVGGSTGNPEDVVIRAVTTTNRCMQVDAGPQTTVHSLVLENGHGGDGDRTVQTFCYGACLNVGHVYQDAKGQEFFDMNEPGKGGVVSNCVIRGGSFNAKFNRAGGAFVYGPDALITHCVISNNVNGGSFSDNGWFGAAALDLQNGARAENCLITDNRSGNTSYYQAAVNVGPDATLRYSTIVGNRTALVGGVNVIGNGRFEKCVIAGNTLSRTDTTDPRHTVWGAFDYKFNESYARIVNGVNNVAAHLTAESERVATVGAAQVTNACDCDKPLMDAGAISATLAELFRRPARGDYRPRQVLRDIVPQDAEASMPATDLLGLPRLSCGAYDLGCYEAVQSGLLLLVR